MDVCSCLLLHMCQLCTHRFCMWRFNPLECVKDTEASSLNSFMHIYSRCAAVTSVSVLSQRRGVRF